MDYYGNNDWRDYLAHYGVKGMKWRHRKKKDDGDAREAANRLVGSIFANAATGNYTRPIISNINRKSRRVVTDAATGRYARGISSALTKKSRRTVIDAATGKSQRRIGSVLNKKSRSIVLRSLFGTTKLKRRPTTKTKHSRRKTVYA